MQERIINELHYYLLDNTQAWLLNSDGTYTLTKPDNNQEVFVAQQKLLHDLAESS